MDSERKNIQCSSNMSMLPFFQRKTKNIYIFFWKRDPKTIPSDLNYS